VRGTTTQQASLEHHQNLLKRHQGCQPQTARCEAPKQRRSRLSVSHSMTSYSIHPTQCNKLWNPGSSRPCTCWQPLSGNIRPALHSQPGVTQTGRLFQHKPEAHVRPLVMKQRHHSQQSQTTVSNDALLIHILQQSTCTRVTVQITHALFNINLQEVAAWSSQHAASQNLTSRKGPGCKILQPDWQASMLCRWPR